MEETVLHVHPYRIEFDGSRNWTVTKRVKTKKTPRTVNDEADQHIGYYGTLESAMKSVIRDVEGGLGSISTTSRHAITDALTEIDRVRASLEAAAAKLAVGSIREERITSQ